MRRSVPYFWIILLCLTALAACKRSAPLRHQFETFSRGFNQCSPADENCTYLKFSYPVFTQGPNPAGLKAIQRRVMDFLLAPTGEKKASDLEGFAKDFFADFQAYRQQFPNAPQVWSLERSVDVLVEDPRILSLSFRETQFLGGAHPNSTRTLVSLNPENGAPYTLDELLLPGYLDKLNALGEKKFREVRKIPEGQGLEEAGFDFPGGKFKLNDNFAAGADGLIFYFNPYEVAAYVYGPTEVEIGYGSLKELVNRKGPLRDLAK
ncbi:DUF3298 and DUF4163 domain-containing protein [bacterium]|nr:MAG: DUF3298 and DUF4163 domain-containing protein [bacterium]